MVTNLKQLNKKQIEKFVEILKEQYELEITKANKDIKTFRFSTDFIKENKIFNSKYFSIYTTNKNKYYLTNKEVDEIDTRRVNLINVGIYLGEMLNNYFRPSVELTHIIAPYSNKNIIEIDKKNAIEFLNGFDLFIENLSKDLIKNNFILVIYENKPLGIVKKTEDRLSNLLSKGRRILTNDIPDF